MRKLSVLLTILFLAALPLGAQIAKGSSWTALSCVYNIQKIDLSIDYSDADILGEEFEEFVKGEANWSNYEPEIRSRFIRAFNQEANDGRHPHRLGTYEDSACKMVIKVTKVRDKGSEVWGTLYLYDAEGNILFARKIKGEKGRFGSVCNLMGDAFDELGEVIGKILLYLRK